MRVNLPTFIVMATLVVLMLAEFGFETSIACTNVAADRLRRRDVS